MADNKGQSLVDEDVTFVTSNAPASTTAEASLSTTALGGAAAMNACQPQEAPPNLPPPDYYTDDVPPAYQVASALPTYEESELTKGTLLAH